MKEGSSCYLLPSNSLSLHYLPHSAVLCPVCVSQKPFPNQAGCCTPQAGGTLFARKPSASVVGPMEGAMEGGREGRAETEGIDEGAKEGESEGRSEGRAVGEREGEREGEAEGLSDGAWEDGAAEGFDVGNGVG
jgi:hypothetical protein